MYFIFSFWENPVSETCIVGGINSLLYKIRNHSEITCKTNMVNNKVVSKAIWFVVTFLFKYTIISILLISKFLVFQRLGLKFSPNMRKKIYCANYMSNLKSVVCVTLQDKTVAKGNKSQCQSSMKLTQFKPAPGKTMKSVIYQHWITSPGELFND